MRRYVETREGIILTALSLVGTPYRWGGDHPDDLGYDRNGKAWVGVVDPNTGIRHVPGVLGGLDCSGFVRWVRNQNCKTPIPDLTSHDMWMGWAKTDRPEPGDVALYGDVTKRIKHVTLCLTKGGTVVVGANGGTRPLTGESLRDYALRMRAARAEVKVETGQRGDGARYRRDFVGFRRLPLD